MKYTKRFIYKYKEFKKNSTKSMIISIKIVLMLSLSTFIIENLLIFNHNLNININKIIN